MDHIVYLDTKANELENLLAGKKTMIIRGATGRKLPYGRVYPDDILYFVRNNGEGQIMARTLLKRYLGLVEVDSVEVLEPFEFDRSAYGNMDDWLPVEDINKVSI